jgi:hypothetical protein
MLLLHGNGNSFYTYRKKIMREMRLSYKVGYCVLDRETGYCYTLSQLGCSLAEVAGIQTLPGAPTGF